MSAHPLVSCIVPVFNGERFLGEALQSIVDQTYPNTEIIVVDDGSTDGSAAVAERFGHAVRLIRQPNAGPASARNAGIEASTAPFVAFLDADDRWHPEKLARQVQTLTDAPDVALCVTSARTFGAREETLAAYCTSTLLVRRDVFDRVGLFDPQLRHSDDTDWFVRARAIGLRTTLLDDVLLERRLHATNMSRTGRTESFDEYLRLLKSTLDKRRSTDGGDV